MNINFTERFISAIELAAVAHQNQIRKGNQKPYIVHPYTVGMLLLEANCSEDTIIAGILHDVVEDTYVGYEEIEKQFGQNVMLLIRGSSEPNKEISWEDRKKHTIHYLEHKATVEVCQITCADKLHNIISIRKDYEILGEQIWSKFKKGKNQQQWYYESMIKVLGERLKDFPLYNQLKLEVSKVFPH